MIKRLIFDVDNTLITGVNFIDAISNSLKRANIYSLDNVNKFIEALNMYETLYSNYNKEDYLKLIGEKCNCIMPDNFLDIFFDELKTVVPQSCDEIRSTIKNLSERYELVLLTNYFSISQINRLNTMGIGKYFKEVYGEKLIKPNPESYINACGDKKPSECVMIGDSYALDIDIPLKLGLNAIFVNTKNINTDNINCTVINKVEDLNYDIIDSLSKEN